MAQTTDELLPTRASLLERLKDWQNDSSWRDFYEAYKKLIYGVAIKHGLTNEEAEDVVQETMLIVARQMPSFKYDRKVGSFKAWLFKTTRWRIASQLRKRGLVAGSDPVSDDDASEIPVPEEMIDRAGIDTQALWDAEWSKSMLNAAIAKVRRHLDPQKYQIFDFYVNKQFSPEKIAKFFSIPVSQVYLAKHRVTEMIKEEIKAMETATN
jgi:RNA polymerase sigma-70 factor (ECF subfamily)